MKNIENQDWYKLDNAAKIFPAVSSQANENMFRVAVRLTEDVNPEILQTAAEHAIARYPFLAVRLRKGFFWYYLDYSDKKPTVSPEREYPCALISRDENNDFLFRITYFKKRLAVEMFHTICDGFGAVEFLKTLTFEYLRLSGKDVHTEGLVRACDSVPLKEEFEDSFLKYYDPKNSANLNSVKAHKLDGTHFHYGVALINGWFSTEEARAICKAHSATVTEFFSAAILYAIYRLGNRPNGFKRPLRLCVPVNLRHFFPSKTLRNFSYFVYLSVDNFSITHTFESILEIVKKQMKEFATRDFLAKSINSTIKLERNFFIRIIPREIKMFVMKKVYNNVSANGLTSNFSNVGKVTLPDSMKPFVDRFEFACSVPKNGGHFATMCSFEDKMMISFTRSVAETDVEREFFRILTEKGLSATIESNDWEVPTL